MSELLAIIKQVLELGWPAIVLIMLVVVWRRLVQVEDRYADIAARLGAVEFVQDMENGKPDLHM